MASLFDGLRNVATNLVGQYGKTVTISREVSSGFDPVTGEDTTTTLTQTVKGVDLPASGGKIKALDERYKLDGHIYDRLAFLDIAGDGIDFAPKPGDKVTKDGEDWYVLGVTPTKPDTNDAIIYGVALRI